MSFDNTVCLFHPDRTAAVLTNGYEIPLCYECWIDDPWDFNARFEASFYGKGGNGLAGTRSHATPAVGAPQPTKRARIDSGENLNQPTLFN